MSQTTLITGASAGIGEAFARECAARGDRLILVARRADRLEALAAELKSAHQTESIVIPIDLGTIDGARQLFTETEKRGLIVDLLINNAGFGKYGTFEKQPLDTYDQMVQLNITSLVDLSYLYVAGMRARKHGGILNVASVAGFPPTPYFSVYGASKAFVLSFSQALAVEVHADNVKVSVLCPGATVSEFQAVAGSEIVKDGASGYQTSAEVAREGLQGYEAGKVIVVTGLQNKVAAAALNFIPRSLVRRIAGSMSRPRNV